VQLLVMVDSEQDSVVDSVVDCVVDSVMDCVVDCVVRLFGGLCERVWKQLLVCITCC